MTLCEVITFSRTVSERARFTHGGHPSDSPISLRKSDVEAPEPGMSQCNTPAFSSQKVNNIKVLEYVWHILSMSFIYQYFYYY
jgi:hypothetical protein